MRQEGYFFGMLLFYSGISIPIVGSLTSSTIYFGTYVFHKSVFANVPQYPLVLILPIVGAMGNIISSTIMVPKELITQRMRDGMKGRSWQVEE